jgi:hypothetical protein
MPDGGEVEDTLDNDGSGRLGDEIVYEADKQGVLPGLNVGLVGWSWGGGMCDEISNWMATAPYLGGSAHVTFAATVDGEVYGTGNPTIPLYTSPAAAWGGWGFNYFELNPIPGQRYPILGVSNMGGASANTQFANDNHGTIGIDPQLWSAVDADLNNTFGGLSE